MMVSKCERQFESLQRQKNNMKQQGLPQDYKVMARRLREHGWTTWYHPDNWVKEDWDGKHREWGGLSTEAAHRQLPPPRQSPLFD